MMKGKMKTSTTFVAVLIAGVAMVATVHMQTKAKADKAAMRHKIMACAAASHGLDCDKIRAVVAR